MTLAVYVHDMSPFLVRFGGNIGLRWYGLAYVGAFLCAWGIMRALARRKLGPLHLNQTSDFITWTAMFGVLLGGRLGYVLFYGFDHFLRDPLYVFRVWEGGMASHGGVLGIMIFTWWYSRKHRCSWTGLGDNLVVAATPGLFLGRIANFINGELYGRPSDVPWAVVFPKEVLEVDTPAAGRVWARIAEALPGTSDLAAVVQTSPRPEEINRILAEELAPRHPSQLYEGMLEGLVLFAILWLVRTRFRTPNGLVTGLFFVLYAIFRIVVEQFREPDAPGIAMFTRGQFLSLFMLVAGAAFILAALRVRRTSQNP
jgi:phosphatidylglycerol:prolipoprotein diacylglycerol transferase